MKQKYPMHEIFASCQSVAFQMQSSASVSRSLRTAFAKSCNTTFAQLAGNLDSRDLTNTAAKLGLGVNYSIPGMITVMGAGPSMSERLMREPVTVTLSIVFEDWD